MQTSLAASIPVENVFSDIESDYRYYDELQTLYDRGMIFPDADGRFNPYSLLERDEFVGISMEVVCERCVQPHTEYTFIEKYWGQDIYFDVQPENNYFYCIAEADDKNIVKGYDAGYTCENNISQSGERPFCPQNTITLEESIAVLLRNSGVFTIEDNQAVMQDILAGNITEDLSEDVSPTNSDGTPYTFYGYLQKALEFELIEFDTDGNEQIYRMLELTDGKLRSKEGVTKQEFILLAYIVFKSNSCSEITGENLALDMSILPATCSRDDENCSARDVITGEDTYDFNSEVRGYCEEGIDDPEGYIWRFHNTTSGDKFFKYGEYLDDINFSPAGNWTAYLRILDVCGNTGEVRSTFLVEDENQAEIDTGLDGESDYITVDIEADPLIGFEDLLVSTQGFVTGGVGPYTYNWDFGDEFAGVGSNIEHVYDTPGTYELTLIVTDSQGSTGEATVLIIVLEGDSCDKDSDGDGIPDCEDKCPSVSGVDSNLGCPILDNDDDTIQDLGLYIQDSCAYDKNSATIFGNAVCNSCPCSNGLDFLADIRKCDIIFPAITSPDASSIYSKGRSLQIR